MSENQPDKESPDEPDSIIAQIERFLWFAPRPAVKLVLTIITLMAVGLGAAIFQIAKIKLDDQTIEIIVAALPYTLAGSMGLVLIVAWIRMLRGK